MNFEKFNKVLRRDKLLSKLIYGLFVAALIIGTLYMAFIRAGEVSKDEQINVYLFCFVMSLLSIYAITAIIKLDKLYVLNTMMSQEENEDALRKAFGELSKCKIIEHYAIFSYYSNSFFPAPYKAYIFAGDRFIALNIKKDRPGIIDFGASQREQNRIKKLIEDQFSSNKI